ncbi:hypothetical protein K6Y31_16160 [Motilimonas cestriensis]|uniref:chitinase n=1 Tax=Motilimonas cestriensis TaxID=2742685 RepID=A0ABS8WFC8_9GAMM|nr:glycosyl hydrolase family 18 protein [Motilimonas cestriensis]MCE2596336.1 hypothetical protein [Motilimonas cestriensis]
MNMKLSTIASLVIGACVSSQAMAAEPIQWQAGQTKVTNGDLVIYNNSCYVAKNNPGTWETPTATSWFWSATSCGTSPTVEPTVEPSVTPTTEPTAEPSIEPTQPPAGMIVWVPGTTRVSNGDQVSYNDRCFEAKNNPGPWETPAAGGNWFWNEIGCDGTVPTQEPTTEPTTPPTQEPTIEPTLPPTQEPTIEPTLEPTQPPSSGVCDEPAYVAGTSYVAGDVVQNNEKGYECVIGGWCSSDQGFYYEPGVGSAWQDAWAEVKACPAVVTDVTFTAPVQGSAHLQGSLIDVAVNAKSTDANRVITSVEFFANDISIGTDTNAPFTVSYKAMDLGNVALKAVATDSKNLVGVALSNIKVSDKPVVVDITAPSKGKVNTGKVVAIEVSAESIPAAISKVDFYQDGAMIGSDTSYPYSYNMTFTTDGDHLVKVVATDSKGNSAEDTKTVKATSIPPLADRAVIGYWHNFENGSGFPLLPEVSPEWDIINVSFAEPKRGSESDMTLEIQTKLGHSEAQMKSDIEFVQARGQKVLISIGGANAHVKLKTDAEREEFTASMIALIENYGFDGLDIDLEGGSTLALNSDDKDFRNPTTPTTVNMIRAVKDIIAHFNGDLILSMAPETLYVQSGYRAYGPLEGAYLPIIHALRDELTVIHVQLYNTGSINALDGQAYGQGTPDFIVAMTEMMLTGFKVGDHFFPGLRADQVAIGLPSIPAAAPSGGFVSVSDTQKAMDYLISGKSFGGKYVLQNPEGYNNLRGVMTWSINWDRTQGSKFVNGHASYFDSLPPVTK